jgi:hypothetical protein
MQFPVFTDRQRNIIAWFFSAITVALSATLVVNTLRLLDRGFDFTDEAFYLMVAAQPAAYDLAYGLWGYGLHPLYELVGGSIAHLRRVGALVLIFLGAITGVCVLRIAKMGWRSAAGVQIVAVSMCVPLTYYSLWIPTPSYNWIVAVGAMFLLIAVILLYDAGHRLHSAAAGAVAAVLVLMTRPLNMLGFGAIYLAAIFLAIPDGKDRRAQIWRAACFAAIAAIGIAVILPVGAIVSQSREYAAIFGVARPIQFSFADQQVDFVASEWLWPVSALVFAFVVFLGRDGRPLSNRAAALVCMVAMIVLVAVVWRNIPNRHPFSIGTTTGMLAFFLLSVACLKKDVEPRLIALLGVAAVIPWIATLGSANAVSIQLGFYAGLSSLIVLAGATLIARRHAAAVSVAAVVALHITFSAIESGLASPYRLAAPVASQVVPTELGPTLELKLDGKTSAFVMALRKAAKQGGFCRGDTTIDLSGSLPGAVFAIDGHMPVFPWVLSGYPFSNTLMQEYLKRLGQKRLERSWLITGETSNSFSMQTLQSMGIDFAAYRLVHDLRHPVDDTSVKLYAPLQDRGVTPCGP